MERTVRLNEPAPDFRGVDLHGRPLQLSEFRGRRLVALVLTNTFACRYCRAQLAALRDAYGRFADVGAEIVVVGPDPREVWEPFFTRHQLPFVGVPDPERRIAGLYQQEHRLLGLAWLPAVFLVDLAGRVQYARYGASTRDTPVAEVLLAEVRRLGGPGRAASMTNTAPERRSLLAAGADAFSRWHRASWDEYWRQGLAAGATATEWLGAILARATAELVGEQVAADLLGDPWRRVVEGVWPRGGVARRIADLVELDGVQEPIVLLVRLLEIKDPYTAGHSERVATWATQIARRLRLTFDEVEDVALAGVLHDVGKVVVPTRVLAKPGRLNDEEWVLIRSHPVAGADVLERLTHLGRLVPAVRHHHEQWTGGGYPDGLVGAEIPLPARILAVCDAYDALTSTRSYRAAMTRAEAVHLMRENERGQWETGLVDLLGSVVADDALTVPAARAVARVANPLVGAVETGRQR